MSRDRASLSLANLYYICCAKLAIRMQEGKKRILFIINPISGVRNSSKETIENIIEESLDTARFSWECIYSKSADHVEELSREAAQQSVDIIAAVGGDGTANRTIKGLIGSNSIFALIPSGSGNGLARHLNISLELHKSISLINDLNTRLIDTVSLNDNMFASIAGVGFDALVAKKFSKSEKRGFFSYFHIALRAYPTYRPRKYRMQIDGVPVTRKALFVSFANSNQFGYNTIIAPDAEIDDGFVDVCIVKKVPFIEAPYILGLLWRNKLDNSGYLEIIKAKEVMIKRNKNKVVNLDGEPIKAGKNLHIKVNPSTLRILIPKQS